MKRQSGILMHISSLYGDYSIGSFGKNAFEFIDFLKDNGFSVWQVLPFTVTDEYNSPYKSFSAFGGNPYFIDPEKLFDDGLISADDLTQFQGDERSNKIMYIEIENDEDKPEVVPFPIQNLDKEFTATDESVIERIYAQFHQELFYSIRLGKLGFSGQVMRDAYEYYASEVTNEQRMIQRAFAAIGKHMPKIANYDYTVQSLVYKQAYGNE